MRGGCRGVGLRRRCLGEGDDDGEDDCAEGGAPEAGGEQEGVVEGGVGDCADDGPGHGVDAAEEDHEKGVDGFRDADVGGEDAAFGIGEQAAREAGGEAGGGEGGHAEAIGGEADGFGALRAVSGSADCVAEGGVEHTAQHQGATDA